MNVLAGLMTVFLLGGGDPAKSDLDKLLELGRRARVTPCPG